MNPFEKDCLAPASRLMAGRLLLSIVILAAFAACTSSAVPGVDPNLRASIRWYTGEAGIVDDEKARQLLVLAAADGDPVSTMWVARVYSTGRMGYPADKTQAQALAAGAIAEVEALASAGLSEAQFLMGTAFAEALGKVRDDETAARWYRLAADSGHILAAHNMGNIHYSGTGVAQDDGKAVHWWMQAARAGDAIPQFRLGEMYEQGRGVAASLERAKFWYQESARRGNGNARDALDRIGG